MPTQTATAQGNNFSPKKSYILLFISILITVSISYFIYFEIQNLFKVSLQERVKAIAQTSALLFDTNDLDQIKGPESIDSDVYKKIVFLLQEIRFENPSLEFVDIYRRTDEPHLFEYVADADSLNPDLPFDLNGDGIIDDEDALNFPGDIYDGTDVPNFVENAFLKPDVDQELEYHQWGASLDASSPIFYNGINKSDYVFNISTDVSEFLRQANLALLPFVIFVVILILVLIMLTMTLVRMWGTQVHLLQELDTQKDELLSIVSHQLATPVSSVKWYLEMMKDGDLGPMNAEQLTHVTSMQEVAANLSDLVSMILDVSRIQLGRMHIEKQELDLNGFFKEILEIIEPKALEKKVNLVKKLPATLPVAQLDKRYTHMTIENLLSNAIKYTPENGEVDFTVTIEGNMLKCVVKDTGVGIPEADKDKIFGKLFRASNVRNTVDGNGFGLYVAKGAVEAQGGTIQFESVEGEGTTFMVQLPLK